MNRATINPCSCLSIVRLCWLAEATCCQLAFPPLFVYLWEFHLYFPACYFWPITQQFRKCILRHIWPVSDVNAFPWLMLLKVVSPTHPPIRTGANGVVWKGTEWLKKATMCNFLAFGPDWMKQTTDGKAPLHTGWMSMSMSSVHHLLEKSKVQ